MLLTADRLLAREAWTAYLSNRSKFGPDSLHQYARTLPHPDRVYLILPADSLASMLPSPTEWGKAASAILLVGPVVRRKHRNILFIHVRTHMYGDGQGSRLLLAAQKDAASQQLDTLSTSAQACRTWYATLLLLRNGFTGDQNLHSTVVQLPTVTVPSDAVAITFTWQVGRDIQEHILYVKDVRDAQRSRGHTAFADALDHVVEYLLSQEGAGETSQGEEALSKR